MISIQIKTDNAAFHEGHGPEIEVGRILSKIATELSSGLLFDLPRKTDAHPLFDVNGQPVGSIWESR